MGLEPLEFIIEIISIILEIRIEIISLSNLSNNSIREFKTQLNDYQSEISRRLNYNNNNYCIFILETNEQYSLILNCKEDKWIKYDFELSQKIRYEIERIIHIQSKTRQSLNEFYLKKEPNKKDFNSIINYSKNPPDSNLYTYMPWTKSPVKVQVLSYIRDLVKFNKSENAGYIQSDFSILTCPIMRKLIPIKDMFVVLEGSYGYLIKELNEIKKLFISNQYRCEICGKIVVFDNISPKESKSIIHKACSYSSTRKEKAKKKLHVINERDTQKDKYYYTSIYVLSEEIAKRRVYKMKKPKASNYSYFQPDSNATIKVNSKSNIKGVNLAQLKIGRIIEENEEDNKDNEFLTQSNNIIGKNEGKEYGNTIKFFDAISFM